MIGGTTTRRCPLLLRRTQSYAKVGHRRCDPVINYALNSSSSTISRSPRLKRTLVLTSDAFHTLIKPKGSIESQYLDIATQLGVQGLRVESIKKAFSSAIGNTNASYPNSGKDHGLTTEQWWGLVTKATFAPFETASQKMPEGLNAALHQRFASKEGYILYPDVMPLFQFLRQQRDLRRLDDLTKSPWDEVVVGVVSNTDERMRDVLMSFGLQIAPAFVCEPLQWNHDTSEMMDVDFLALSYHVGVSKPNRQVFDETSLFSQKLLEQKKFDAQYATSEYGRGMSARSIKHVHVGDDRIADGEGAHEAGWTGIHLLRPEISSENAAPYSDHLQTEEPREILTIPSLKYLEALFQPR